MLMSALMHHRPSFMLRAGAGLVAGAISVAVGMWSTSGSHAAVPAVSVFPVPGGHVAAPTTQITFRGIPAGRVGSVLVTGSESGTHAGRLLADSDGMGGSFIPSQPFKPGERVTVTTGLSIVGGVNGSFSFTVATPAGALRAAPPLAAPRVKGDVLRFVSAPQVAPVAVHLTRSPKGSEPGDLFVAPLAGPEQYGPMILGPHGSLIWFKSLPHNESAADFRVQTYRGKPVLTWWQGTTNGGVGTGQDEIYSSSYQPVATVKAANGVQADLHEFQLTSNNTALITAYYPVRVDASSIKHGTKRELVLDSVAQEIDIPTGLVLFQWDSLDHVPLTASYLPAPTTGGHPWDYFHINSIQDPGDGSLVVSSRNTSSVYDISHQTGAVNWVLNGKASSFKMGPGAAFAFQHDARLTAAAGSITLFDDGAGPPVVHKQSRAITLRLDTIHHTATLLSQDEHRPQLLAEFAGNDQTLPDGDSFVGWGGQPFMTEFNAKGQTVFDARFADQNSTYRAYRFAWAGTPATRPSESTRVSAGKLTVYASWDGATEVASWRVLGGDRPTSLRPVATAARTNFEVAIRLSRPERYVVAQALDARNRVLGSSKPTKGN
jgi:hypothetical protein